jgi:phosphate:Na+ symporter
MTLLATTTTTVSVIVGLLQVLGALGVFLYGMKIMSEAVQRVAGKRMRMALSGLTTNRFTGVFTGFITTSLVQSSSATTVLVVSFVNAGLLTLIQSIGVIMGANLGTTITAWIVAVVGKFSVGHIALPMIGVGLPFVFIGKDKAKSWGEMLLGFGLVFFGLGLLKDSVPDVKMLMKDDPGMAATIEWIVTWMGGRGFASVLLYLTGGVILTLLVQSSSAAMAITMTCALNGWLGDVSISEFRGHCARRKHRHDRDRVAGGAGGECPRTAGRKGSLFLQRDRRVVDAGGFLSVHPHVLESRGNASGFVAQGKRQPRRL